MGLEREKKDGDSHNISLGSNSFFGPPWLPPYNQQSIELDSRKTVAGHNLTLTGKLSQVGSIASIDSSSKAKLIG